MFTVLVVYFTFSRGETEKKGGGERESKTKKLVMHSENRERQRGREINERVREKERERERDIQTDRQTDRRRVRTKVNRLDVATRTSTVTKCLHLLTVLQDHESTSLQLIPTE